MSNTIKYSESSESLALNKGNWWIGTGDSNKGPSDVTGYYAGVTPPSSGYTIYIKREDNLPSIFVAENDQELIFLTNQISESNFTTTQECLNYYQTQDDKLCVNREYENIVTDGLVLNLDAGHVSSYPESGATWYDLSGNDNDGTLINGTTFSGGSMVFDGVDDYIDISPGKLLPRSEFTAEWFLKIKGSGANYILWISEFQIEVYSSSLVRRWYNNDNNTSQIRNGESFGSDYTNQWVHIVWQVGSLLDVCYLNGAQIGFNRNTSISNPIVTGYAGNNYITWVGRDESVINMNDDLSVFRFYNRILSPQEILQNYNAQKSRFGL